MKKIADEIKNSTKAKKVILDTDTFNEIDDQFAIAYAMLSDKIDLLSVNAAPFTSRYKDVYTAKDGMDKSYDEILRIMELTDPGMNIPAYRGSDMFMENSHTPVESEAANNIINTVLASDDTVYTVAIGAATNVASALLKKPEIANRMVVVWLGGNTYENENYAEFNMMQDYAAAQALFDSNVPLVQIPAHGVTSHLKTTVPELSYYLGGKNPLCDYLIKIVTEHIKTYHGDDTYGRSKVIWDIAGIACLAVPDCFEYLILPKPAITADGRYRHDPSSTSYVYINRIERDIIFRDLLPLLSAVK